MPTDLAMPDDFLLTHRRNGETWAIRVRAYSHADAIARIAGLSDRELKALTVGRLSPREPDPVAAFGRWIGRRVRAVAFG